MRATLALLLFAFPTFAGINPVNMKVGDSGKFFLDQCDVSISEVGKDWISVRCKSSFGPTFYFVVRDIDTKGLVDDKPWKPTGEFTVTGTEKYRSKTVFTVKSKPPEKK